MRGEEQGPFLSVLLVGPDDFFLHHQAIDDGLRIRFTVRGNNHVHEVGNLFEFKTSLDFPAGAWGCAWNDTKGV